MQVYYDEWQFKHPQPQDLRVVLERESGKDLSWLFDEIIPTTKHIDYSIAKVKTDEKGTRLRLKIRAR